MRTSLWSQEWEPNLGLTLMLNIFFLSFLFFSWIICTSVFCYITMYQRRLFLVGPLALTFLEFRLLTLKKDKYSSDHYTLPSCGILLHQQRQTNTHDLLYLWVFSLANFTVFLQLLNLPQEVIASITEVSLSVSQLWYI